MSLTSPNPIPSIVPKKRPRPVKSCLTCRSKKLKCDREQPCSQCVKNKHPERCVFDERAGGLADPPERAIVRNKRPNIHTSTGVNGDLSSRPSTIADGASPADENGQPFSDNAIGDLRSRIRRLESLVPSVADSNQPKKLGLEDCLTLSNQHNSAGNLGAESRKEYYGLGNTRSLITLFPDVVEFVTGSIRDGSMESDFQNLQNMFPKEKIHRERPDDVSLTSLLAVVPSRSSCDHFMGIYFCNFETVYRILHVPTFLRQCEIFWTQEYDNNQDTKANFVSQLLMVTLCGAQLYQPEGANTALALALPDARRTCVLVDAWLSGLSGKRRTQLSTLQTSCLLVLLKQILSAPSSELWQCTGDLVRSALAIGLHKDPDELSDLRAHPFQAEIRRRLWYTIAEVDLQVSISCCMPSLVQTIDYSCRYPTDMDDTELSAEGSVPYDSSNRRNGTRTSSQNALARSLVVRLRALRILTQIQPRLDEIRDTLLSLEFHRSSLPLALRLSEGVSSPSQLFQSIILDLCYRRPILSLYTLGLQCLRYVDAEGFISMATEGVNLCMTILSYSEALDPDLSDHEGVSDDKHWKLLQAVNGDDILRAAYCACMCMEAAAVSSSALPHAEPSKAVFHSVLGVPKSAVRRMIEDVVKTFVKRKPDLRTVLKQLVGLALASELTKQAGSDARKEKLMGNGTQRILRLCRERHAADKDEALHGEGGFDSVISQSSSDWFDQWMAQDFGLDSTYLDWDIRSTPYLGLV